MSATHELLQALVDCLFAYNTMVALYKIEVTVRWMRYKLARCVRKRDGVLLELHPEPRYLENTNQDVSDHIFLHLCGGEGLTEEHFP